MKALGFLMVLFGSIVFVSAIAIFWHWVLS
jgi:hypothetical protein